MVLKSTTITAKHVEKVVSILNQLEIDFKIGPDDVELSTFDSGAISNIYKVTFKNSASSSKETPSVVVVKLYQTNEKLPYSVTSSQLVNLIAGQSGLAPRVLLLLSDAIVWEYLGEGARELKPEDDYNLKIRKLIAQKLARFHALTPPVSGRNGHRKVASDVFDNWFEKKWLVSVQTEGHPLNVAAKKLNCSHHLNSSVEEIVTEMQLVKNKILDLENSGSTKIVFTHGDFNHSNIMIKDDGGEMEVRFVDFDFSAYFYRGADIGHYFNDATQIESYDDNELLSDEEMRTFIRWYLEETKSISGGEKNLKVGKDLIEKVLKESKLFVLFTHWVAFIFCLFSAHLKFETDLPKAEEFLNFTEQRYRGYLRSKKRFVEDGSLDFSVTK